MKASSNRIILNFVNRNKINENQFFLFLTDLNGDLRNIGIFDTTQSLAFILE